MKRTLTVIVLGLAALALLVGAALKSRSIPLETHLARYTLTADIERLNDDFNTLINTLQTAWRSSQAPGEAASALRQRLVSSLETLETSAGALRGSSLQRDRIQNTIGRLQSTMATVDELTATLIADQTAYAESIALLRDNGPEVVRQLRDIGQARIAAELFQLLAETIDFAAPESSIGEYQITRLLTTLNRDQRIDTGMRNQTGTLLGAVDTILETKDGIRSRLVQLSNAALVENADALNLAATAAYQSSTSSAESARTMLSIYAVVMLLSVGVIGLRLRGSYRELNIANTQLGVLNESLEQRVQERTEDLSNALAELKESQVQLVQAEKMSSLGQLVAGISHEINTPLLYRHAERIRPEKRGHFVDQARRLRRPIGIPVQTDRRSARAQKPAARFRTRSIGRGNRRLEPRQRRRTCRSHRDGAKPEGLQPAGPGADRQLRRQRGHRQNPEHRAQHHQTQS
jgi:signal transduction histidine kinase